MDRSAAAGVFASIDRPVWVVTSHAGERRGGLLATWVFETSIDPEDPHLLVGLAEQHFTAELVGESGVFAAHLLRPDQADLALHFALGTGRNRDKLAGLALRSDCGVLPILTDCAATMQCQVVDTHQVGDRRYFWGCVIAANVLLPPPWLMASGVFAAASPDERATLLTNLAVDIEYGRRFRQF